MSSNVKSGLTTVGFAKREPTPYASLDAHAASIGNASWAPEPRSTSAAARLAATEIASAMSNSAPAAPSFIVAGVGTRRRGNTAFQIVRKASTGAADPEAKILIDVTPGGLLVTGPMASSEIVDALKERTEFWRQNANSGDIGAYLARIMREMGLLPHMDSSRIWVAPSSLADEVIRAEGAAPGDPTLEDTLVATTGGSIRLRRSDLMSTPENIRGATEDAVKAILAEVEAIKMEIAAKTLQRPSALEARKQKLQDLLPGLSGWKELLGEKFAELQTAVDVVSAEATAAALEIVLAGGSTKKQSSKEI
jgi:hypothetical protein